MSIRVITQGLLALMLAVALAACGGEDALHAEKKSPTDTTPPPANDGSGGEPGDAAYRIGTLSASGFTENVLDIPVELLAAGGSTQIAVHIVGDDNAPYSGSAEVSFSSACTTSGTATIDSPVTLDRGRAETTYTAKGCSITDTITATVTINDVELAAHGDLPVQGAKANRLEFVSASFTIIGRKGSGGIGRPETSTLVFKVVGEDGTPLAGQSVRFSVNPKNIALDIHPATATSNADGEVHTTVSSGSIITSVRVTATLDANGVSTQSDSLKVGSGLPVQSSFSISADTFNPSRAWEENGIPVSVSVHLADRFGNRVPDGTVVTFMTEGGSIDNGNTVCVTADGECTVTWKSQNPRPADGRVTILAYALGEEDFVDTNGNNLFDSHEIYFEGRGEPFLDVDETGSYDISKQFVDTNENGVWDAGDGHYNGTLCASDNDSCNSDDIAKSTYIWDSIILVMSGRHAVIYNQNFSGKTITLTCVRQEIMLDIRDEKEQILPAGTTISATSSQGTLLGNTSWTVANQSHVEADGYKWLLQGGDQMGDGLFEVTVTTPSGQPEFFFFDVAQAADCP